jgi:hypothetical protein
MNQPQSLPMPLLAEVFLTVCFGTGAMFWIMFAYRLLLHAIDVVIAWFNQLGPMCKRVYNGRLVRGVRRSPTRPIRGQDVPTDNDDLACVVCATNVKCCAAVPCGHVLYCIGCANKRQESKCAQCRAPMKRVIRIFN